MIGRHLAFDNGIVGVEADRVTIVCKRERQDLAINVCLSTSHPKESNDCSDGKRIAVCILPLRYFKRLGLAALRLAGQEREEHPWRNFKVEGMAYTGYAAYGHHLALETLELALLVRGETFQVKTNAVVGLWTRTLECLYPGPLEVTTLRQSTEIDGVVSGASGLGSSLSMNGQLHRRRGEQHADVSLNKGLVYAPKALEKGFHVFLIKGRGQRGWVFGGLEESLNDDFVVAVDAK